LRRRIDEIKRWHCAHCCTHTPAPSAPIAWRYAVVRREYAFALTVSARGGQFALHRPFTLPGGRKIPLPGNECDLLAGRACTIEIDGDSLYVLDEDREMPFGRVGVNHALAWWAQNAVQDEREQPDSFWRGLDALGKEWIREARSTTRPKIRCPWCGGAGFVKPVK